MSSKPDIDTFAWTTAGDGIDNLRHHVTPRPTPGPTDVLVQVSALSLNYRDLLVVNGVDGWRPPKAIVPISDACGLVVATGEDVTRFRVGDRILPTYLPKWRTGTLTEDVYVSPVGGPTNRGFLAGTDGPGDLKREQGHPAGFVNEHRVVGRDAGSRCGVPSGDAGDRQCGRLLVVQVARGMSRSVLVDQAWALTS